jgi:hypothetical protein
MCAQHSNSDLMILAFDKCELPGAVPLRTIDGSRTAPSMCVEALMSLHRVAVLLGRHTPRPRAFRGTDAKKIPILQDRGDPDRIDSDLLIPGFDKCELPGAASAAKTSAGG